MTDNVIPLIRAKRELGPEDCTICGINRSICLDTACPGDGPEPAPYGRISGPTGTAPDA